MAPVTIKASSILRLAPKHPTSALSPALSAHQQQRRCKADVLQRVAGEYDRTPKFESPFKNKDENPTTKIPSFANYMSKKGETSNRTFQYFMVGGMGLLAAAGAKATVQGGPLFKPLLRSGRKGEKEEGRNREGSKDDN